MEKQSERLRKTQSIQTLAIVLLSVAVAWLYFMPLDTLNEDRVIHAKGIVLHDQEGRPRMAIGFPIENQFRRRDDTLSGMVFLDEGGMDRVHLSPHGKLYLGGEYYDRTNEGWSLFFNDEKGEERSGYGFSDSDNSVGLGMDYGGEHGGEAIYLYAAPGISFMTINADLQENQGIRDRIVLWHETEKDLSVMKVSDSQKDGRILFKAEKGNSPTMEYTDSLKRRKAISPN